MKKLVCININGWFFPSGKQMDGPKKDDIVVPIKEEVIEGDLYYRFAEYPYEIYGTYNAKSFVPYIEPKFGFKEMKYDEVVKTEPAVSMN